MSDSNLTDQAVPTSRRERGKIAQREYRKRHASKFHGLQEENKRLRDAIRGIADALVSSGDGRVWPELEAAVSHANDVAGLEPLPPVRTDMSAGAAASAPQAPTPGGFLNTMMAPDVHSGVGAHHSMVGMCANPGAADAPTPSSLMYHSTLSPAVVPGADPRPSPGVHSGNGAGMSSSPSLTGPSTSDPIHLVHPDAPAPLIDDRSSSLAGLISWACTSYAVSLWRTVHRGSASATTQLEDFLDEHMLGALRLMTDQAYLASLARARARHCAASSGSRHSTGGGFTGNRSLGGHEYAHAEDDTNPAIDLDTLRERYHKLAASAPGSWDPHLRQPISTISHLSKPDVWRSPRDVEDHLSRQATPDELERVRAVVQGRRSAGDYDVLCVGRYVVSLCANFVCSPGGPRWHAMFMTMATGLMLRRLRGESIVDAGLAGGS